MKFKEITVCLDMYGCPNRCKHCWLGITPNGNMEVSEIRSAVNGFKSFAEHVQVYDWYREPDYRDNYKELYRLCNQLSSRPIQHFELVSFWRLVRDTEYVKWLSSIALKSAQLTIFGCEETTDFYIGRKGAYKEILEAIEILINHKISPRIQTFINKNNIDELEHIERLIEFLDLENRCMDFGGHFSFFLHQGSCDAENEKLYDIRVTSDDLPRIPALLKSYTLKHFGKNNIMDVFGRTEQSLYEELSTDHSTSTYVNVSPVFYIDKDFNVYPNITAPSLPWCLGNLKKDGVGTVLDNYIKSNSLAQRTRLTVPLCDIVKSKGDKTSKRLFTKDDYITFVLNKYCRY